MPFRAHVARAASSYAKRNAVAIPKIKLGKITVQMLLAAVLIHALHAALENRVVTFDRVRMDFNRANVFIVQSARPRRDFGELLPTRRNDALHRS